MTSQNCTIVVSSKDAEQIACQHANLIDAIQKLSKTQMVRYSSALKGLSSCDVEKGTEQFWISKGKNRLNVLREIHAVIHNLATKFNVDVGTAIGAFRMRQRECLGKPNLSIGRFRDVDRIIRRLIQS